MDGQDFDLRIRHVEAVGLDNGVAFCKAGREGWERGEERGNGGSVGEEREVVNERDGVDVVGGGGVGG